MYFGSSYSRYARCRVNKSRWFWVVFNSYYDEINLSSNVFGYKRTMIDAHIAARQAAGFRSIQTRACTASDFLRALRRGTANRRPPWLPAWCVTLSLTLPCGIDEVKAAYRRLAKSAHPDTGGNAEDFMAIERAYRDALAYCLRSGPPLAS
jgi:hypothetical protein